MNARIPHSDFISKPQIATIDALAIDKGSFDTPHVDDGKSPVNSHVDYRMDTRNLIVI